jgi:hypothetical protein
MGSNRPGGVDRRVARALAFIAALVLGCRDDRGVASPPPLAPAIAGTAVAAGPHNVLSAVVSVSVRDADSVVVWYRLEDAGAGGDGVTPAIAPLGDSAVVAVLGLLPGRRYLLGAIAYGMGGPTKGDVLKFNTDTLPADLPRYSAGGVDPSPGFVVFAAPPPSRYAVVIDNTGRVVWYRRFASGPGLNFQPQPTGRYTVRPPTPDPTDREPWLELDVLGTTMRTFGCAGNLPARFHDLIAEADGSYWIMCDETRTMDLTGVGGVAGAQVTGTVIQHVSAAGVALFHWSPFGHFAITDLDSASRTGSTVNWTHGNAIAFDADGNLLASFRSLSEITKIDTRSGAVMWRLGGLRNQFAFAAPGAPFARQHGLRVAAPGHVTLLDNLGEVSGSRGERYAIDDVGRTAQLEASYASAPAVVAQLGGTTQNLPGGRTLVAYGNGGRVEEYDATGRVVWRIEGNPGYVFRATRIASLYAPGVP